MSQHQPHVRRAAPAFAPSAAATLLGAKPDTAQGRPPRVLHSLAQVALTSSAPQNVQFKLTVNTPGDSYEQEADATADQVMRMSLPAPSTKLQREEGDEEVQRKEAGQDAGGEDLATADVSSVVSAGLAGGGRPLDPSTRAFMEPRFGHDFSQVRIHNSAQASSSASAVAARAYTLGNNIAFRAGEYAPGSGAGRHLLAHELTHVVQQGASTPLAPNVRRSQAVPSVRRSQAAEPGVVQRAIGFEFETGYKIEKKTGLLGGVRGNYRPLAKMEKIQDYGSGLSMEADENTALGSTIEFVVDPPIQEVEVAKLKTVLNRFDAIGYALDQVKGQPAMSLDKATGTPAHADYRVTPIPAGLTGNPQITGGIDFTKMFTLMKEANRPGVAGPLNPDASIKGEIAGGVTGGGGQQEANRLALADNVVGSEELKGMIALLAHYLSKTRQIAGPNPMPPQNYAKLISGNFMARTDFGTMFSKLPLADRTQYVNDRPSFVTHVLTVAGLAGLGNVPVFERGIRENTNPQSPQYNVRSVHPVTLITRSEWLRDITKGEDRLSSSAMPAFKSQLEGLGALGTRTDQVGNNPAPVNANARDKGSGIILELRGMRGNVHYKDFITLADEMFNYIVGLNARP